MARKVETDARRERKKLGGEADEVSTVQAWIERARSIIHKTY